MSIYNRLLLLDPSIPPDRAAALIAAGDLPGLADAYMLPRSFCESPAQAAARRVGIAVEIWLTWGHGLSAGATRRRLEQMLDALGV